MDSEKHDTSRRTILKGSAIGAGALLGAAGLPAAARAAAKNPNLVGRAGAVEYFVQFNSAAPVQVTSVSFGAGEPAVHGRKSSREPGPSNLEFTAPSTPKSPTYFLDMAEGRVFKTVEITLQDVQTSAKFVKIDLANVIISSYSFTSSGDGPSSDHFTLSYETITYSYAPIDAASGQLGKFNSVVWNTRTDKIHTI
jgi:type VI protein secretion system component Hcp